LEKNSSEIPSQQSGDTNWHRLRIPAMKAGLAMQIHKGTDSGVSRSIRNTGCWEQFETQLVLDWLKSGNTFVDVGANIGYYTLIATQRVGNQGQIYAFEPDPDNFQLLQANLMQGDLTSSRTSARDGVTLYQAALGDHQGTTRLYLNKSNRGDHQIYDNRSGRKSITVQLHHGDTVLAHLCCADLIKIDTQGAEYQVLSGLSNLIRRSLPRLALVLEFWPRALVRAGDSSQALCELLSQLKLEARLIDHVNHRLEPRSIRWLERWGNWSESPEGNEGFVNLWLTGAG